MKIYWLDETLQASTPEEAVDKMRLNSDLKDESKQDFMCILSNRVLRWKHEVINRDSPKEFLNDLQSLNIIKLEE